MLKNHLHGLSVLKKQSNLGKTSTYRIRGHSLKIFIFSARPELPYRRYGSHELQGKGFKDQYQKQNDGKNPIRNFMRLLCRFCLSDEHLLRNCPKLSPAKRVHSVKSIFALENITSESDECNEAFDSMQEFDDRNWGNVCSLLETETSNIHFVQENPESVYKRTYSELADRAYTHKFQPRGHEQSITTIMFSSKYGKNKFEGVCMDDRAQKNCAGFKAYQRYCDHTRTPVDLIPSNVKFRLGDVVHNSIGSTVIRLPIDSRGNFLEYYTDIINVDLPTLFGLNNMKKHRWYVNEVTDEFCSYDNPSFKVKLKLKLGHLYLDWPENLILFTRPDLLRIQRRFAHPTPEKL